MKKIIPIFLLLSLACGGEKIEKIALSPDLYSWECDSADSVYVNTQTYECRDTGLHFITASVHMKGGQVYKTNLKNIDACLDSNWDEVIPVGALGHDCELDVDGVVVEAFVDKGTWADLLFE